MVVFWIKWILVDFNGFKNLFDKLIDIIFLCYCFKWWFVLNLIMWGFVSGLVGKLFKSCCFVVLFDKKWEE